MPRSPAATPFDDARLCPPGVHAASIAILLGLVLVALGAPLLSFATMARAHCSPSARDRFARIIDRSDAIIMGRVLDAGLHWIPDGTGRGEYPQGYARIAVERWIVGPDTDSVVEVRLGQESASPSSFRVGQADRRVIVYLLRSLGKWWLQDDIGYERGRAAVPVGLEVLSPSAALDRIPAIRKTARASSPESLAVRAHLAVVGSLDRFIVKPPGMTCRVERVVFGAATDSVLTVVTRTYADFRRGPALLLLAARPDSTWEVLSDGAGCYYLDQDRVAHLPVPAETLFSRVAAAHARGAGGTGR